MQPTTYLSLTYEKSSKICVQTFSFVQRGEVDMLWARNGRQGHGEIRANGAKGLSPLSDAIAVAEGTTFPRHFLSPSLSFLLPSSLLRKRLSPLSIFEGNEQETLKGRFSSSTQRAFPL